MIGRRIALGRLLEKRASGMPERTFLLLNEGVRVTYGDFNREVNRLAHGLRAIGVQRGDPVVIMLPNSLEFLLASYALKKLGAIEVAVNRAFRGAGLAHAVNQTGAELLFAGEEDLEALRPLKEELVHLRRVVFVGAEIDGNDQLPDTDGLAFNSLLNDRDDDPNAVAEDTDAATVLFTSGTTGRSKGCVLSHRYAVRQAELLTEHLRITEDDCLYTPFPLYHLDAAHLTVVAAMVVGARAAVSARFSARRFWSEVREFEATIFDFMGATLTILWKQDEHPDDAENPVRLAWGVPVPSFKEDFERRFGLQLVQGYGMTDAGVPCYEDPDGNEPFGSCGRPHYPYEVRIVDDRNDELQAGEVGEIVIRSLEADVMMKGYWGMPEATVEAFRNLWFHTGDLGRFDAEGHLFFAGRKKDAIRRRGENISAYEVEEALLTHDGIEEAAAIGVPSELTEEDVAAFVVLRPGVELGSEEIREFCRERMARFMVPDYIEIVDSIPKTPTGKIEKYKLIERGVTR